MRLNYIYTKNEAINFLQHKLDYDRVLQQITFISPQERETAMYYQVLRRKPYKMSPTEMNSYVHEAIPNRMCADDKMTEVIPKINQEVLDLNKTLYAFSKAAEEKFNKNRSDLISGNVDNTGWSPVFGGNSEEGYVWFKSVKANCLTQLDAFYPFVDKVAGSLTYLDIEPLVALLHHTELYEALVLTALTHPFYNGAGPLFAALHPYYFYPGSGKIIIKALIAKIEANAQTLYPFFKVDYTKVNFKPSHPWKSSFGGLVYCYVNGTSWVPIIPAGFMTSHFPLLSFCAEYIANFVGGLKGK